MAFANLLTDPALALVEGHTVALWIISSCQPCLTPSLIITVGGTRVFYTYRHIFSSERMLSHSVREG